MSRLDLFPITTTIETKSEIPALTIAGQDLVELANQYGTPLYLYDQATLESSLAEYQAALSSNYPGPWGITYAGKAFLSLAMAQWLHRKNLWVDCTGVGEITVACEGGVERERILVHGVNKSPIDLQAAVDRAGIIVVDNLTELSRLATLYQERPPETFPDLWLRIRPGMAVDTHVYTQTGQEDSKFGLNPVEAETAIRFGQEHHLPLKGLHFHLGSHFHNPTPLGEAIEAVMALIDHMVQTTGWLPQVICTGGGWGVPYHEDDLPHLLVSDYVRFISEHLIAAYQQRNLPLPQWQLEPGRSLVARAGVVLYRVGAVKHTAHRRWLLVDGGMADNIRPALYRARYSALPVQQPERAYVGPAWIAGPYCESSDVLVESLLMADIQEGELIAIPVAGAYHISMGSNYNGSRRPAVLWLDERGAHLIQRRETILELYKRDILLDF